MKRAIALIILLLFCCSRAEMTDSPLHSIHKEHEKIFSDSLFSSGAAVSMPISSGRLSHLIYGFIPYWEREYRCPDWRLVSRVAYFSCTLNRLGQITGCRHFRESPAIDSAKAAGVKIDVCVSLFSESDINALLSTPAFRRRCISEIIDTMLAFGANGVNIDFEFPGYGYGGYFLDFAREFRESLDARAHGAWLSVDLPAVDWRSTFWTDSLRNFFDAFFVMCYGYHWRTSPSTGPIDPLDDPTEFYDIAYSIYHYKTQSGTPGKIILGLPLYGYDWACNDSIRGASTIGTGTAVVYATAIARAESIGKLWDDNASSPWYRYRTTTWHQCWFSDSMSLDMRFEFAIDESLMGVGFWALGYDRGSHSLWNAIRNRFWTGDNVARGHILRPELKIVVSPNPFNSACEINISHVPKSAFAKIISPDGRVVFRKMITESSGRFIWNPSGLPAGVYLLEVMADGNVFMKKIIYLR